MSVDMFHACFFTWIDLLGDGETVFSQTVLSSTRSAFLFWISVQVLKICRWWGGPEVSSWGLQEAKRLPCASSFRVSGLRFRGLGLRAPTLAWNPSLNPSCFV